jgi:hypothetical protein
MIDKWFLKDLENILDNQPIAVFIDGGDADFLTRIAKDRYTVFEANSEIEELQVKYLVESKQPSTERFVIHTRTKREDLKYIREYCETNGCLEIPQLQNYIKEKVHKALNLNINFKSEEMLTAAKMSVGKDKNYWLDLCHKGSSEIFDLKQELLPFLHDPQGYAKTKYDPQILDLFYHKVNEFLNQEYITKPAKTLAKELVTTMFDALVQGTSQGTLHQVYVQWVDSVSYKKSLQGYISDHALPSGIDLWQVNSEHPFEGIDHLWLKEIGQNLADQELIKGHLPSIRKRAKSRQALTLGIDYWTDIVELIEFDAKNIVYLSSFQESVDFYTKHFFKLDTAIRNLYARFLNQNELLQPFQELYREHVNIFLDKWFKYFDQYSENQTGTLQHIIDSTQCKVAIIVGDGVSYELARQVSTQVDSKYSVGHDIVLSDLPSETENNMSRIYMDSTDLEPIHSKREKYLSSQNASKSIEFIKLDKVNQEARQSEILICTYKDIDDMGEKLQQKALKYFPESIEFFAEKIQTLLESGYKKVFLISDHGFVLTGLLSESDKVQIAPLGHNEKAERYIRTKEQLPDQDSLVKIERKNKGFEYLYFSKTMNPFKTPGVYGFSHGGATPQEIITPLFSWEHSAESTTPLAVKISNKSELEAASGEVFQIKVRAEKGSGDVFSASRKMTLIFFHRKSQVNKSDVFSITPDEVLAKDYTFDGYESLEVQLVDAVTKQLIDKTTIRQTKDRDLGGL